MKVGRKESDEGRKERCVYRVYIMLTIEAHHA